MKKVLFLAFAFASFAYGGTAFAEMKMMHTSEAEGSGEMPHNEEINAALQEIYLEQNITDVKDVQCDKVTDEQFEKLGNAYMGAMIAKQEEHNAMHEMMEGEDSMMSQQAHMNMGQTYLNCGSGADAMPMMGGTGMMKGMGMMHGMNVEKNKNLPHQNSNLGWEHPGSKYSFFALHLACVVITTILVWTLLILWILTLIKGLKKK